MSTADDVFIIEHNVKTGEVVKIPTTEEALNRVLKPEDIERLAKLEIQQAENLVKRQVLLDKLGITEEEAKLLLS